MINIPELSIVGLTLVLWLPSIPAYVYALIRFYVRWATYKCWQLDDVFVFLAILSHTTMLILYSLVIPSMYITERVGEGLEAPPPDFEARCLFFLHVQFALIPIFWTTLWLIKASFLAFYKQLLHNVPHLIKYYWVVVIIAVLSYIGCWFTQIFACSPVSSYFTLGACQTPRDIYVSNLNLHYSTAVDCITDVIIMILPLRILWNLQRALREKLILGGIFCGTSLCISFAMIRVFLTNATSQHVNPIWLSIWTAQESCIAIIVSCLPATRQAWTNWKRSSKPFSWRSLRSHFSTHFQETQSLQAPQSGPASQSVQTSQPIYARKNVPRDARVNRSTDSEGQEVSFYEMINRDPETLDQISLSGGSKDSALETTCLAETPTSLGGLVPLDCVRVQKDIVQVEERKTDTPSGIGRSLPSSSSIPSMMSHSFHLDWPLPLFEKLRTSIDKPRPLFFDKFRPSSVQKPAPLAINKELPVIRDYPSEEEK